MDKGGAAPAARRPDGHLGGHDVDIGTILGIVGLVLSVVLGVPPLYLERQRRRTHVRQVWARLEQLRQPLEGDMNSFVHQGGRLALRNGGHVPVWEIIVLEPHVVAGQDFSSLGPGEALEREVPEAAMRAVSDEAVTLQLRDSNGRTWQWTPLRQLLRQIPPPLTPLARLVQWTSRFWPDSWYRRFCRLPKPLQRFLWGYDPEGEDA